MAASEACEGFEIAIEMRLHGAANPEHTARLERHLETCASCRSFEQLGRQVEVDLRNAARAAESQTDLEALRDRGRRASSTWWGDIGVFLAVFTVLAAIDLPRRLRAAPDPFEAVVLVLVVLLPGVGLFVNHLRTRKALEEALQAQFFFFLLRLLTRRRLLAAVSLGLYFGAFSVFLAHRLWVAGGPHSAHDWLETSAAVVLAVASIRVLFRRVPWLLRERAELPPTDHDHLAREWSFVG